MTEQQLAAQMTRRATEWMIRCAGAVPENRQNWSPMADARTVLDLVVECIVVNRFWADVLGKLSVDCEFRSDLWASLKQEHNTVEPLFPLLRDATERLASVIESVPEEALEETLTMPWGDGFTQTVRDWLFNCYENTSYHTGQINYVQTLYGDTTMRA